MEINLKSIAAFAEQRTEENYAFRTFLKQSNPQKVDALVQVLNVEIAAKIDCTACGNCCKSFMISVNENELAPLATTLSLSTSKLKKDYLEKSSQGNYIVNTIPCHFLEENKCTIYSHRFETCRQFPHLHTPGFTQRLFSIIQHYGICPIVFNVVEALKTALLFK